MSADGTRRSRAAVALIVLRTAMIVAGILCLGRWGIWSLGGAIDNGYLLAALGLFVGAYAVSFL